MTKEELMQSEPPVAALLGREIVCVDNVHGGATIRFTARPDFSNRHGTVQGGLQAAMLDSVTAVALYSVLPAELTGLTTQLNVSFLKPAKLGAFVATSKVVSRNERDAETSGELRDAEGTLVATATAKLRIVARRV